jgi:hypothetical protein
MTILDITIQEFNKGIALRIGTEVPSHKTMQFIRLGFVVNRWGHIPHAVLKRGNDPLTSFNRPQAAVSCYAISRLLLESTIMIRMKIGQIIMIRLAMIQLHGETSPQLRIFGVQRHRSIPRGYL